MKFIAKIHNYKSHPKRLLTMIELNSEFLKSLANAAQAKLGRVFDIHTDSGRKDLQTLAKTLIENPDDKTTIDILEHISEQPEPPNTDFHPGFMPKIDHDFHLAEKYNYFRRGKTYPTSDDPSLNR